MRFKTLFFDLDDTLYPNSCGLWEAIRGRMSQYMVERMGLTEAETHRMRAYYYQTYGTTLRGLQIHHQVDPADFLAYVHDLDLKSYLTPTAGLRELLLSLPQQRWIFTNADNKHAARVLQALDLEGVFEGVIDIWALEFACKPEANAYQRALALAHAALAGECALFDDTRANLDGAHRAGFTTFWVSADRDQNPNGHIRLAELLEIPEVMPELWQVDRSGFSTD